MFTGIIQAVGEISAIKPGDGDMHLQVHTGKLNLAGVATGDSIAVNGVCLTVVVLESNQVAFDVSRETLSCTTLQHLQQGSRVNLERALTLATPLGGHLVSGHVDGLGTVVSRSEDARSVRFSLRAPDALARYIAAKGSICVDGVSLTVNRVQGALFEVNIVPHTLQETTFGEFAEGRVVNLEVDIIARYLERLMLGDKAADAPRAGISRGFLAKHGYLKED